MSFRKFYKNLILSIFISVLFILNPASKFIKADTLLFRDDFNNNEIGSEWQIKGYTHEILGSYSNYSQLDIEEVNGKLRIYGQDFIPDQYIDGKLAGWFGSSLVSKNNYSPNKSYSIKTKVNISNALLGYITILLIEFDSENRIALSIGNQKYYNQLYWPIASQLLIEENKKVRCVGNNLEEENQSGCINVEMDIILNKTYELEIRFNHETKQVFGLIDGNIVHAGTYKGNLSDFHVGIAAAVRYFDNYIDAEFDDFEIYSLGESTPDNPNVVPNFKQFSLPWGPQEYDSASNWYPLNPTIKRWGCAMTSAAMILRYYNHDIDPERLNLWLKNRPNGYNREGGVVWPTISVFSKENTQKVNPDLPLRKIEWQRYQKHDNSIIDYQLSLNQPVILNVPGHFIVAKGKTENDYLVNDPGSNTFTLLSQVENYHQGQYWKIETFKPTNTDLSYIYILVDDDVQIEVFDQEGNKINEGYFREEPIKSNEEPFEYLGNPLNSFALPSPQNGYYKVRLSGNTENYQLDAYFYDKEGNSYYQTISGSLDNQKSDILLISYDNQDIEKDNIEEINFDLLINNLNEFYKNEKIKNYGFYNSLKTLLLIAKNFYENNQSEDALKILDVIKNKISLLSIRQINEVDAMNLIFKINLLIESI